MSRLPLSTFVEEVQPLFLNSDAEASPPSVSRMKCRGETVDPHLLHCYSLALLHDALLGVPDRDIAPTCVPLDPPN
jgi:hypothetical protein